MIQLPTPLIWLYAAVTGGIVSRTLVPYLVIIQQEPHTKFDRAFLLPALIAVVLGIMAAPLLFGSVTGSETYVSAYVLGWGGTDIIREGLKVLGGNVPALKRLK